MLRYNIKNDFCNICFLPEAMNKALQYEAGQNFIIKQVKDKVMKQTQGLYPAPLKIIDVSIYLADKWLSFRLQFKTFLLI